MNKQQQNHHLSMDSSRSYWGIKFILLTKPSQNDTIAQMYWMICGSVVIP